MKNDKNLKEFLNYMTQSPERNLFWFDLVYFIYLTAHQILPVYLMLTTYKIIRVVKKGPSQLGL